MPRLGFRTAFLASLLTVALPASPLWSQTATPSEIDIDNISLAALDAGTSSPAGRELASKSMPFGAFKAMMASSLNMGFRTGLGDSMIADLENSSPGIIAEVEKAIVAAAQPHFDQIYELTTARYAVLFTQLLTPTELAELTKFYSSELGQKVAVEKYRSLTETQTFQDTMMGEGIQEGDMRKLDVATSFMMMKSLTSEERVAVMAFETGPAAQKMRKISPVFEKVEILMAQEANPELDAAVLEAAKEVFQRRMAN